MSRRGHDDRKQITVPFSFVVFPSGNIVERFFPRKFRVAVSILRLSAMIGVDYSEHKRRLFLEVRSLRKSPFPRSSRLTRNPGVETINAVSNPRIKTDYYRPSIVSETESQKTQTILQG